MVLCDYLIDDDDFDPEAGFQKEDPQNQWEGEDEGLDIDVSRWDPGIVCMILLLRCVHYFLVSRAILILLSCQIVEYGPRD